MNDQAGLETEVTASPRWWWWATAGLALLLLFWLGVTLGGSRPLKPLRQTAVPPNATINGQPLLVNFADLNENPAAFINKRIRVSGSYYRLETVDCELFNGPHIQWGLIADGLQLNARGFEAVVLPIVTANTLMTLDGIWRRYPGPAGCGKEPPSGLWYLEVEQIVQPNPLVASTPTPVAVLAITPPPFPTVTPTATGSQPPAVSTALPNVTIVSTVAVNTPVASPTLVVTASPTLLGGSPTATPTSSPTGGTPTAVTATPTVSPTATPTASVTPGAGTATPTPTNLPLVTATPGDGYPGPTASPTASPYP